MKIAIVCSRLCFGGAERVAVIWANGFMGRGHNVVLISNLFEEQTYYVDERITLCNLVSAKKNKIKKWCSAILALFFAKQTKLVSGFWFKVSRHNTIFFIILNGQRPFIRCKAAY